MLLADGLEKAFVGSTISAFNRNQVALYDYDKCIEVFMDDQNMSEEEAMLASDGLAGPVFASVDAKEGMRAFKEKRPAKFSGQ